MAHASVVKTGNFLGQIFAPLQQKHLEIFVLVM
jgi:hypothetical protein